MDMKQESLIEPFVIAAIVYVMVIIIGRAGPVIWEMLNA